MGLWWRAWSHILKLHFTDSEWPISYFEVMEQHVDFAALAAEVDLAAPRPSRERGGRLPFLTELMFLSGANWKTLTGSKYKNCSNASCASYSFSTASPQGPNYSARLTST